MGKKKPDAIFQAFYEEHINKGNGPKRNPANDLTVGTEILYRDTLTEMAMNRFKWEGLPESISPRFLEALLFNFGLAVIWEYDAIGKPIAIKAQGVGQPNYQGDPVEFNLIAPGSDNIHETQVPAKDVVPVWANYLRTPEISKVILFARRLAAIDRTLEINTEGMRYTKLISVSENQRHSWAQIMRQHAEGQPVIYGTEGLDPSVLGVFDIGVPAHALPTVRDEANQVWNQALTFLGINNANQDKKERLIADEVGANNAHVAAIQAINLNSRRYAAEQMNKKFNLNVTVDFQDTLEMQPTLSKDITLAEMEGNQTENGTDTEVKEK